MQEPADPAATGWEDDEAVSISSYLRCDVLAGGHLHNPAVLCLAWGTSLCHQVHAMVTSTCHQPPV